MYERLARPNIGVLEDVNQFSSRGLQTPALDSLAERSLVLTNAYTQLALCGPSRIELVTKVHTKVHNHEEGEGPY